MQTTSKLRTHTLIILTLGSLIKVGKNDTVLWQPDFEIQTNLHVPICSKFFKTSTKRFHLVKRIYSYIFEGGTYITFKCPRDLI